ncbi:hypothetical protein GMI70_06715 [Eggerthellaceae bacterium zg-893]|nr:hypothetical protein [Eggerthellaceae bacterium zg-893]
MVDDHGQGRVAEAKTAAQAAEAQAAAVEGVGAVGGEEALVGRPADDLAAASEAEGPDPQLRELLENNALADVFADVTVQSADSRLVTPDRWVDRGFVPDFMTPDDFEMFVYAYLEDYRAAHPLARRSHIGPKSDQQGLPPEQRTSAHGFRSATKAVGVAPSIRDVMAARRAAEAAPEEDSPAAAVAADAAAAESAVAAGKPDAGDAADAGKPGADRPGADTAADAGRPGANASSDDCFDQETPGDGLDAAPEDAGPFANLNLPEGYELVECDGEWVLASLPPGRVPPRKAVRCETIAALVGTYSYYLYDTAKMTDSYAHWAFLAAEGDPLATFADCVREDSRTYPRPLAAASLANEPFCMTSAQVDAAWRLSQKTAGYEDICRVEASNGDVYFYSMAYLSEASAASLAEWYSVGRRANP